jgi:hypothetical protein
LAGLETVEPLGELLEAGSRFEFRLVYHEEVAGSALAEVGLRQDILHACDWADIALIVDVFELIDFVGLIDDPVASLEVDKPGLSKS